MIIIVRTRPRPRNWRSRSRAMSSPRTRLMRTTDTVRMTVTTIADRGVGVGEDPTVVLQPVEADLVRVVGVPVHERDAEGHDERQLRDDDHEDQRGQEWCPTGPGAGASQGGVVRGRGRRGAGAGGLGDGAHEPSFLVSVRRRMSARGRERPVTARRFTARPWTGTGQRRPRRGPVRCPAPPATLIRPAIAELTSCETWVPRSGNSGMPMNWMPVPAVAARPGCSGRRTRWRPWSASRTPTRP